MFRFAFVVGFACALFASSVDANPLDKWRISCGVDKGSITKKGRTWTFKTSSNHCPGGIFTQRAEIYTDKVSATHRGAYLFTSRVSMTGEKGQKFGLFQIHDGRHGCAPPLKIDVTKSGHLALISDIKTGPGESCIRGKLSTAKSPGRFVLDGKEREVKVLVVFDGEGNFDTTIWLDNKVQATGRYEFSKSAGAFQPEKYFFKHGVYSQYPFRYEMVSRDVRVKRVKISN
ncbi:hypothetical protein [Ruegeria sp. AD91A]|uniref:hypothetical protein n=1 Tax=Ruegeria sp. AD91A TaxID=2293862 RepID=UPI0013C35D85|nr:hypothetical protein [Ruegeria sp. AD91A]